MKPIREIFHFTILPSKLYVGFNINSLITSIPDHPVHQQSRGGVFEFDSIHLAIQNDYLSLRQCNENYTGWPRKNATLTINNFKKTRDRMKKLCALLRIKFFSQQDDTKIVNFDKGVLILWPFF